ncbi:hypothetical protein M8J76_000456 [Diaphorina citri]|nr:hypothetical protein M8J76_000456 [Diaphorina citri]
MYAKRLLGVLGDRGKTNDVIFCKSPFECSNTLVFFPGDVQDYLEEMSPEFSEYNIGSTASLLSSSFPDHHILVIKPNRMELKTYACYDNFVSSNKLGIPNLTSSHCHDTINHLDKLLQSVAQRTEVSSITRCKLTLVGFSKGCVVLNALLYSMFSHPSHPFLSSISDMVWLDGGHGGNTNTWVTDHSILENFTKLGIGVSIFVSPYQVSDVRRPWIHQEEQKFHETLRHLGVSTMKRKLLAQDLPVSLKSHFLLLKLAVQARFS